MSKNEPYILTFPAFNWLVSFCLLLIKLLCLCAKIISRSMLCYVGAKKMMVRSDSFILKHLIKLNFSLKTFSQCENEPFESRPAKRLLA